MNTSDHVISQHTLEESSPQALVANRAIDRATIMRAATERAHISTAFMRSTRVGSNGIVAIQLQQKILW